MRFTERWQNKIVGWLLIGLAITSIILSTYTTRQQAAIVKCQVKVNEQYLANIKSNADLAALDRENTAITMAEVATSNASPSNVAALRRIIEAKTPEEGLKALQSYLVTAQAGSGQSAVADFVKRKADIDARRKAYPPIPTETCGTTKE